MHNLTWKKRVWIPIWIIQIITAGIFFIIAAIALGVAEKEEHEDDSTFDDYSYREFAWSAVVVAGGVYIGVSAPTLIFNITEIVLFARHKLSPVTAVVLSSLTTLIWTVMFALLIVSLVTGATSVVDLILIILLFGTSVWKLVYSSIHLHRHRKGRNAARGAYAPANAEAGFGTYTAYKPAGASQNVQPSPFRDPSREPSPAPNHHASGAATEYYDPARPAPSFEMQQHPPQGDVRYN